MGTAFTSFLPPFADLVATLVDTIPQLFNSYSKLTIYRAHTLISIITLGILITAALQASLLYLQNWLLRHKPISIHSLHRIMRIMPPLQTMEASLFQMIRAGFFLLSAALGSAFLLLERAATTTQLQKIILSLLAWGLFAALLYARHYSGLRGRTAIRHTFVGVGLLISAYLAGKFIH